ncbi:hypothetical protein GYMLUDRAFT_34777 [Collybiopsis luxurians FD-317 M1]|nr:hypothetical protein GYMLUDRAFT_34777 [Collybiopsis luxurians FD-317 M1]
MPGPGGKKNGTKKKPAVKFVAPLTSPASPDAMSLVPESFVEDIDSAEGWKMVVEILCDYYKLPDLSNRSGLKRVHANFEAVWRRLDAAFAKHSKSWRVRGGIIGIYAKMSADAILRDKLFERGFLSRLIPLLDIEQCRHLALRSLSSVAHHGSEQVFLELAKLTHTLTSFLVKFPDDPAMGELIVTILSHTLVPIQNKIDTRLKNQPQAQVLKTLDMKEILKQVTLQMRKPSASRFLIQHGSTLVSTSAFHCSEAVIANASSVHFLIAGLRSAEWETRSECLNGLIRLFRLNAEDDIRVLDPHVARLDNAQKRLPDHLIDTLGDYGMFRTETFMIRTTARDFQGALMQVLQDRDMYKLGLNFADLITRTEFSIADGVFEAQDPVTGRMDSNFDTGLPFRTYREALPQCAKVLRRKAAPGDLDKADILEIKYYIMGGDVPEAARVAEKALQRNPHVAYFQYARSMLADTTIGLRAAKKGLMCKITTPFVRFQLMQRAVQHAGEMGLRLLEDATSVDDQKWEEGVAFLTSAWRDSKTYVAEAPPDNRNMRNVLYWNILLTIVIQGPEFKSNLEEIKTSREKLSQSDELCRLLGLPTPRTCMRLTQEAVVSKFPNAVAEWEKVILQLNDQSPKQPEVFAESEKVQKDLKKFLDDDLNLDDGGCAANMTMAHPKVNTNNVVLYQCSYCSNPSAVLRKCSGCAKARYCDASCQKLHWGAHKKKCSRG